MNILIYSNTILWDDHFATTFELVKRFQNHNVYLFTCDKSLNSCPANYEKLLHICETCQYYKYQYNKKLNVHNISLRLNNIELDKNQILKDIKKIKTFEDLTSYFYEDLPVGELAASQFCTNEISHKLDEEFILKNKREIFNEIVSGIKLFLRSKEIIKEKLIDKVYVWNGRRSSDGPINYAAKNLNIPFKSYICNRIGEYFLVRGEKIHSYKETMKKFDNAFNYYNKRMTKDKKNKLFNDYIDVKKDGLFKKGNFNYIDFTKNFKKKINKKNLITFFTTSGFEYAGFNDWKSSIYIDQYDAIRKIINDPNLNQSYEFCIRHHPHLKDAGKIEKDEINEILKIKKNNLIQISYDDDIDSYDILDNSIKIITFGSTISYEAYARKIPVITLSPSYDDQAEFTYKPKNHEEVIFFINQDILPKENKKSISHALFFQKKFQHFKLKELKKISGKYLYKKSLLKEKINFFTRLKIFTLKNFFDRFSLFKKL